MSDIVISKKGEYKSFAKQDSASMGVLENINGTNVVEFFVYKDKELILVPAKDMEVTEFCYIIDGCLVESKTNNKLCSGDRFVVRNLKDPVYFKALEDTTLLYLSHEIIVKDLENSINTLSDIMSKLANKDSYTKNHCARVVEWIPLVAQKMNIPSERIEYLVHAALFHDIGKLDISDYILKKAGTLTKEEFDEIKKHPSFGYEITKEHAYDEISKIILQHHEKIDGSGYPNNLKGDDILIEAKIISVIDSYDAMISDRPYRKGLGHDAAINELIKYTNKHYDPDVVKCFLEVLTEKK